MGEINIRMLRMLCLACMAKRKNPFAVGLAKRRAEVLSPERQSEIGRIAGKAGGHARAKSLTAAERREAARKAAIARWGKRPDGR